MTLQENIAIDGLPDKYELDLSGLPDTPDKIKAQPIQQESPTAISQGQAPSLMSSMLLNVNKYFKKDEGAKAVQALVDSETLGISPSAAYKHRFAIDQGIKATPEQFSLRSTKTERVKQSWDIGVEQNKLGELGYKYIMSGDEKYLQDMMKVSIPSAEERFLPESRLEDNVRQAAQMMPMMFDSSIEGGEKGMVVGMGFGLITALMGQYEAVPAATGLGFKLGAAEGVFESAMRKEAGLALSEIMQIKDDAGNQINPQIARAASFGIGVVNGVIEVAQIGTLLKSVPGADKLFSKAIEKTLKSKTVRQQLFGIAGKYASTTAIETGQEIAQESTNVVFNELAIELTNQVEGTNIPHSSVIDIFQRLKDTAVQSAKAFSIIAAPGPTISLAGVKTVNTQVTQNAKKTAQNAGGTFDSVILSEEGKPESMVITEPETGQQISVSVESSEKEISDMLENVRQESVDTLAGIDNIIESDIEVDENNIEEVLNSTEIEIEEQEDKALDLNNQEELNPILQDLTDNIDNPNLVEHHIETLGNAILDEGVTEKQPFINRMKVILGDLWETFKDIVSNIFDKLTEERGSISFEDKNIKTRVRKATGQVKQDATVSEREALKGSIKKQEQVSKKIFKEGVKQGVKEATTPKAETIKQRIARTTGLQKVSNLIKEDEALKAAFTKAVQNARIAFRAGDKEGVAKEKARMKEILNNIAQRQNKKKLINEIKNVSTKAINSNIAVDYKKKIKELLSGLSFKKPTEATKKSLQGLADYLNKNGRPLGINQKHIDAIDRLSKKPISELTTEELQTLKEKISLLVALGKLKAKLSRFADAREKERKLNELLDSTVNIDSRQPTTYAERRKRGRLKKINEGIYDTVKDFYIETLHTPRVADMIDGFQNYKGANAKMIKEELIAEQEAIESVNNRINTFLEKLSEIGFEDEITDEQQIRIMIHVRYQEGAYDAVQTLMEYYGYEIPEGTLISDDNPLSNYIPLSDKESKLIDLIRESVTEKTADVAALHEELTNDIFDIVPDYIMPLLYEKDILTDPSNMLMHNIQDTDLQGNIVYRTKKTFQGFTISRKKGVTKVPRIDIFTIVEEAIAAQEWYLNLQPVLIDHADLVFDKRYKEKAGQDAYNWWKDQIDIVARKGWKAGVRFNSGLHTVRQNLNRGVLLYKVSTILMQPFALIDAIAYVYNKYGVAAAASVGKEFTKSWLNWKYAKKLTDASIALRHREGGEVAMEEILREAAKKDNVFSKFEKGGFSLIQKADLLTAAGVRQGVLNSIKDFTEDAEAEADFIMNITQGSSNTTLRPHILSSGEGYKTLLTFQTFFMNRWGLLIHDIIKSGFKGNWKSKLAGLVSLGIFMAGGMGENEARRRLANLFRKKDIKPTSSEDLIYDVIFYIPEQMPLMGNLVESTRQGYGGETPIVNVAKKGVKGAVQLLQGDIGKGLKNITESGSILYFGVPGTTQLFDMFEYMIEEKKNR